jgi:hypothetical protein
MLTNGIMAEKLEISLYQVRRWTKELLPPDPKATRRSGYIRKFSNNDGFMVRLGGYLVSILMLSFADAREILDILKPWLYQNGLVPDIPKGAKRVGIDRGNDRVMVVDYEAHLFKYIEKEKQNWSCVIEAFMGSQIGKVNEFKDDTGRKYLAGSRKYIRYYLRTPADNYLKKFYMYISSPTVLPVFNLLMEFNKKVLGEEKNKQWWDSWKRLGKDP